MDHKQRREYADAVIAQRQADKQQAIAARVAAGEPARPPLKDTIAKGLGIALSVGAAQGLFDMFRGHGPVR